MFKKREEETMENEVKKSKKPFEAYVEVAHGKRFLLGEFNSEEEALSVFNSFKSKVLVNTETGTEKVFVAK